ncbi:hypothetical protein [Pseudomonas oryzihabitans]|nr:hypothetical protein [Pseudomonas oryzihabitans]
MHSRVSNLGYHATLRYVPFTNADDRLALAFVANRTALMTVSVVLARPSESKQDSLNPKTLQALGPRYADDTGYVLKSDVLGFVRLKASDLARGGILLIIGWSPRARRSPRPLSNCPMPSRAASQA